jgi:hypothetical protein
MEKRVCSFRNDGKAGFSFRKKESNWCTEKVSTKNIAFLFFNFQSFFCSKIKISFSFHFFFKNKKKIKKK